MFRYLQIHEKHYQNKAINFYNKLIEFDTEDRHISLVETPIDEITHEEWLRWVKRLCKLVHRRIEKIIKYRIVIETFYDDPDWNYENWIIEICIQDIYINF